MALGQPLKKLLLVPWVWDFQLSVSGQGCHFDFLRPFECSKVSGMSVRDVVVADSSSLVREK